MARLAISAARRLRAAAAGLHSFAAASGGRRLIKRRKQRRVLRLERVARRVVDLVDRPPSLEQCARKSDVAAVVESFDCSDDDDERRRIQRHRRCSRCVAATNQVAAFPHRATHAASRCRRRSCSVRRRRVAAAAAAAISSTATRVTTATLAGCRSDAAYIRDDRSRRLADRFGLIAQQREWRAAVGLFVTRRRAFSACRSFARRATMAAAAPT